MVVWVREREYRLSTAVEYCVQHIEIRCLPPEPPVTLVCKGLLWTRLAEEKDRIIACLVCDGGEEEIYYKLQKQQFMTSLRSCYPDIPDVCAHKLAETFTDLLLIGNASHRCPESDTVKTALCHVLEINIQPHSSSHHHGQVEADEEIIIRQQLGLDFGDEEDSDEEEFWPRPSPATRSSVAGLLKADSTEEEEDDCGICIEKMETSSMRMPCSHRFHRSCLLEWLNYNHSCPICRPPNIAPTPKSDLPDVKT